MATLIPMTPLLAPKTGPLKPVSPLRPKNAPKTPISPPQRRWRFQLAHFTGPQRRQGFQSDASRHEQRCHRFQTTGPPRQQGLAGQRADSPNHTSVHPAPLVWRAPEGPEGPEGTGGLRGAAPNKVRSPSLAGGRALRRPEHQRRHTTTRIRQRGGYRSTRPFSAHSATASSRLKAG